MTLPSNVPTVTRFAPSPTGYLHLGHAFAALTAHDLAQSAQGQFILRLEDIDAGRCTEDFAASIEEDLDWLGLKWPHPVMQQSERFAAYAAALAALDSSGLVYPCFCTRKDIQAEIENAYSAPHHAPAGPDGLIYPGLCRHLTSAERDERIASGEPYALRLRMEAATQQSGKLTWVDDTGYESTASPEIFGDVVVARKDIPTSYHLAVVVDDAAQGITLVTRGEDLRSATHVHRLLQHLLGLATPTYHHHRLITDQTGKKFSKRDASVTLRQLRESGHSVAEVVRMTGFIPTE